jgi:phosphonate transport system substrate-binding protein
MTLLLGAVAYDPKVVQIWDGFAAWFTKRGLAFDYVLYTNYSRLVDALLDSRVHVAWNSPLAWIQASRRAAKANERVDALVMRDTDRDLRSLVLVKADSPFREPRDLVGRRVAVGAGDSPQATLLPLGALEAAGAPPESVTVVRHDELLGKHGDHIGGERDAVRGLIAGTVDAACLLDSNRLLFAREGLLTAGSTRVILQADLYDHCNMSALAGAASERVERFTSMLLEMSYEDAEIRPLLDMEGLKRWLPGRTAGYAQLTRVIDTPWAKRLLKDDA